MEPKRAATDGTDAAELVATYGFTLDPWQAMVLDAWLGTDENGDYTQEDLFDIGEVPAFTEVGKYYLIYAAALDDNHEMVEGEFVFEIVEPAPETGDTFNLGLWLAVAALTAAAGIVLVLRRKEQA